MENLNIEIWQNIFPYFDPDSRLKVLKVCKLWKRIFDNNFNCKTLLSDVKHILPAEKDQTETCKKCLGPVKERYNTKLWKYHQTLGKNWSKMPLERALTTAVHEVCNSRKIKYIDDNFTVVESKRRFDMVYRYVYKVYYSRDKLVDDFAVPYCQRDFEKIYKIDDILVIAKHEYIFVRDIKKKKYLWKHIYDNDNNNDVEYLCNADVYKNEIIATFSHNNIRIFDLHTGVTKLHIRSPEPVSLSKLYDGKLYIIRRCMNYVTVVDCKTHFRQSFEIVNGRTIRYKCEKFWMSGPYFMGNYCRPPPITSRHDLNFIPRNQVSIWNLNDKTLICKLRKQKISHINEKNSLMITVSLDHDIGEPIYLTNYTNGHRIKSICPAWDISRNYLISNKRFVMTLLSSQSRYGHNFIGIQFWDIWSGNLKRMSLLPKLGELEFLEATETKLLLSQYTNDHNIQVIFDFDCFE